MTEDEVETCNYCSGKGEVEQGEFTFDSNGEHMNQTKDFTWIVCPRCNGEKVVKRDRR